MKQNCRLVYLLVCNLCFDQYCKLLDTQVKVIDLIKARYDALIKWGSSSPQLIIALTLVIFWIFLKIQNASNVDAMSCVCCSVTCKKRQNKNKIHLNFLEKMSSLKCTGWSCPELNCMGYFYQSSIRKRKIIGSISKIPKQITFFCT